jgi:hypothetical protein
MHAILFVITIAILYPVAGTISGILVTVYRSEMSSIWDYPASLSLSYQEDTESFLILNKKTWEPVNRILSTSNIGIAAN